MKSLPKTLLGIITMLAGILFALLLLIQLVPYGRNHTNPKVVAEPQWDSPQTRELFMRTCGDCHSNETTWPMYSNIAPVSWLVYHDVEEGRSKFNVSEWGVRRNEADEAAETYQRGEMPPNFYLPLHPDAKLSAQDRDALLKGLANTFGSEYGVESGGDKDD